ncbi:hypothetical protein BGW41_005046 [Actinomortierella wolfii]|nr:hypothetical protein BGW41_005046 [Actinomortierella wolfii]
MPNIGGNDHSIGSSSGGAYDAEVDLRARRHKPYTAADPSSTSSSTGPHRTTGTSSTLPTSTSRARHSPRSQPYRIMQQGDGRRISATSAYLLQQTSGLRTSSSSSSRLPGSRSKTYKRVSKALPPDPAMIVRHQHHQQSQLQQHLQTQRQKRSMHTKSPNLWARNTLQFHKTEQTQEPPPLDPLQQQHNHNQLHDFQKLQCSRAEDNQEKAEEYSESSAPQKPSGRRIKIEHPYSFYKYDTSAAVQSVTVIESPFECESIWITSAPLPSDTLNSTNSTTLPDRSDMLVSVPVTIQPASLTFQEGERYDLPTHKSMATKESAQANSRKQQSDENPSQPLQHHGSFRQHTHAYQQQQQQQQHNNHHHNNSQYPSYTYDPSSDGTSTSHHAASRSATAPTRKVSGTKIMKIARQASEGALRSVGLSRKPSDKASTAAKCTTTTHGKESDPQNAWSQNQDTNDEYPQQPPFRALERNASHATRYPADMPPRERAASPTAMETAHQYIMDKAHGYQGYPDGVVLSRNQSLPNFQPSGTRSIDPTTGRATGRGMSLNHPKTAHGSIRRPALVGDNASATKQPRVEVPLEVQEDAYGGTTDDWRQTMLAKSEAAAREQQEQHLKDESPKQREGHTSLNSVSTLNLPPQVNVEGSMANVTVLAPPSASRILLPDRDAGNNIGQQKHILQQQQLKQQQEQLQHYRQQQQQQQQQQQRQEDQHFHGNIQRSNTAPYTTRENKAIPEEEENESVTSPPLTYSKSEGALPRGLPRFRRQQQQQQQQGYQHAEAVSYHRQYIQAETANCNNPLHEKDLPPTPTRTPSPAHATASRPRGATVDGVSHHQALNDQVHNAPMTHSKMRSESNPEAFHHHHQPKASNYEPTTTTALASTLERNLSRSNNEAHGANHNSVTKGLTPGGSSQAQPPPGTGALSSSPPNGGATAGRFGLNMVPLPVIPSPDEVLSNKSGVGVLPQDVLRSLDPKIIQKLITQSVIASRVYRVLSFDEIESLQKEKNDLLAYIKDLQVSLTIEMRMRDASHSLIRLHESNTNIDAVKASTSQLHATTRKVDQIVAKLHQSNERLLALDRTLLQHEAATLNAGMRRLDAENRELSRLLLELEKERDHEKAERLRWQKQHTQLRIQSMIFPSPPGVDESDLDELSEMIAKHQQQQQHEQQQQQHEQQAEEKTPLAPTFTSHATTSSINDSSRLDTSRLRALEEYMKELNEEIAKKGEHVTTLETQLKRVDVWVNDFEESIQARLPSQAQGQEQQNAKEKNEKSEENLSLDQRLQRLRLRVDDVHAQLTANAAKAEEEKAKALEFAATTLANSQEQQQQMLLAQRRRTQQQQTVARRSSSYNVSTSGGPSARRQQYEEGIILRRSSTRPARPHRTSPQQRKRSSTIGGTSALASTSGADANGIYLDLNSVLRDSLLELDHHIRSSSPNSIPRSQQQRNATSGSNGNNNSTNNSANNSFQHEHNHSPSTSPSSATESNLAAIEIPIARAIRSNSDSNEHVRGLQMAVSTPTSLASSESSSSWGGSTTTTATSSSFSAAANSFESQALPTVSITNNSTAAEVNCASAVSADKDEQLIGDAHADILRLNAMVDELERLVRLRMQE